MESRVSQLLQKAKTLPALSGCYLMKDHQGKVIYVGKAKKLQARVTSYFDSSVKSPKTQALVGRITDFEFMVTNSEVESLVLENNLIKKHTPKYNIRLRDDKSYPWVMISLSEPFARLEYVRRPKKQKKVELFGPFPVGVNLSQIIRTLTKLLELRDCSLTEFKSRKTPCLLYQMQQCSAPCVGLISEDDYREKLMLAKQFFSSLPKARKVMKIFSEKMNRFAEEEQFEKAAIWRDHMTELQLFLDQAEQQQVEFLKSQKDVDIWASYQSPEATEFAVYLIRGGQLIGHKNFGFLADDFSSVDELWEQVILRYYAEIEHILPSEIIFDKDLDTSDQMRDLAQALQQLAVGEWGLKKELVIQGSSAKNYASLLEMCRQQAKESHRMRAERGQTLFEGLKTLQSLLELPHLPRRLECYDIAIWQGQSPTAAQIVSVDGQLEKRDYRHYHLQERVEGNNDFAMMKEVIARRITQGNLPDVFVIDGGVAQVNMVLEALKEAQLSCPVVGLAKEKSLREQFKERKQERKQENGFKKPERLIIPGRKNPFILAQAPALMKILVQMRDEAHRFSRALHHKAQEKKFVKSWVEEVKGLKETTREKILQENFLSREELALLTPEDLQNKLHLTTAEAQKVYAYFQAED